jgi:hypothetical protein
VGYSVIEYIRDGMSNTPNDNSNEMMNVSAQVSKSFIENFDRSIKKAQIEGEIPMDASRAQVIRGLMSLAVDDTELIAKAIEEGTN